MCAIDSYFSDETKRCDFRQPENRERRRGSWKGKTFYALRSLVPLFVRIVYRQFFSFRVNVCRGRGCFPPQTIWPFAPSTVSTRLYGFGIIYYFFRRENDDRWTNFLETPPSPYLRMRNRKLEKRETRTHTSKLPHLILPQSRDKLVRPVAVFRTGGNFRQYRPSTQQSQIAELGLSLIMEIQPSLFKAGSWFSISITKKNVLIWMNFLAIL